MNSNLRSEISNSLYLYRNSSVSILKSRTFRLANTTKIMVKQPVKFTKKGLKLLLNNPRKIVLFITGSIQPQESNEKSTSAEHYSKWVKENIFTEKEIKDQLIKIKKFKENPLISIITPIFNPPVDALEKLIKSVINQTYGNFELILFNFGDNKDVRLMLDKYAQKDSRLIVEHDKKNKGIGANSNLCLEVVKGEYIGLLDHDDVITQNALFECVSVINSHNPDFIYSDKDKITEDDERIEPLMKPDWSPEMALGGNYMTHFNLLRTSLVRKVGGWDSATDGAQDWDLFLRVIAVSKKVHHIPKILYHWRTVAGSTSNGIGVKPYAMAAQNLAISKYIASNNYNCEAFHDKSGQQYIRWNQSNNQSLVVVNYEFDDIANTRKLLSKVYTNTKTAIEKIVIIIPDDIDITNKQKDELKNNGAEVITYARNTLSSEIKKVAEKCKSENIVYLSNSISNFSARFNDIDWLNQLTGWLTIDEVGLSGGGAYLDDGRVIDIGSLYNNNYHTFEKLFFGTGFRSGTNGHLEWIRNMVCPSEKIFSFKKTLIDKMPLNNVLDSEFVFTLSLINIGRGHRAVFDPLVSAICEAPFSVALPLSNELREYIEIHTPELDTKGDPYYNENLNQNYQNPLPLLNSTKADLPKTVRIVI